MSESLFTKIINKKIPAKIVYEDEKYIVIHDINPAAPVHLLVIPKKEIATLNDLTPQDAELVGGMFLLASQVMKGLGHSDYRAVFNCGAGAAIGLSHPSAHHGGARFYLAAGIRISHRGARPWRLAVKREGDSVGCSGEVIADVGS